jgi:parvulin-like peptidyl-prolyl isomerase
MKTLFSRLALVALMLAAPAAPVAAQSLFAPVAQVNDSVITEWQVQQRAQFLDLFRTPGNTRQIAIDRLIEEQLQLQAGEADGVAPSEEALVAGMTEFAGRVNLSMEEFIEAIGQGGVSPEAFRDFVAAGIVWRELVRARFGPEARPSEAEVNARLLEVGAEGGTRVLLSEIILPATDPQTAAASRVRAEEISRLTSEAEFAAAARLFRARPRGSRTANSTGARCRSIPDNVRPAIAALSPGTGVAAHRDRPHHRRLLPARPRGGARRAAGRRRGGVCAPHPALGRRGRARGADRAGLRRPLRTRAQASGRRAPPREPAAGAAAGRRARGGGDGSTPTRRRCCRARRARS